MESSRRTYTSRFGPLDSSQATRYSLPFHATEGFSESVLFELTDPGGAATGTPVESRIAK